MQKGKFDMLVELQEALGRNGILNLYREEKMIM